MRNYSNTSVETTLTAGIDAVVTSLTVDDATGYPSVPFAIVVDPDVVASEEVLLVTAKAGPLFTVTRAYDGTTAKAHSAGATVIHAGIGADFRDGQVGGSATQVQFNNADSFGGDAGLTYADRELTISGDTDKTTPILTARSGDFHASAIAIGTTNASILYTAVNTGATGNTILIMYRYFGPDELLSVAVVGSAITVSVATDSFSLVTSTANDVIAAINSTMATSALVAATLAPGNDGTGIVEGALDQQLSGGALAADATWIDERGVVNVQLQTGLGLDAVNIRDPAGVIVGHLDNDGGFGFASDHFTMSQRGSMSVDSQEDLPLAGNATLRYAINGYAMFIIAAGGGFGFFVSSPVPTDVLFAVAAGAGQTGDLFAAYDENFAKTVRVLANGDLQFDQDILGPILIDRTTATRYRLFVDGGVLGIEAV